MKKPIVGIIMGSDSDLPTMQEAAFILDEFGVSYEMKITSAHRTPNFMAKYSSSAVKRGIKIIIAGAGGAAHLPGMSASHTPLPVIGVPIKTKSLDGLDSLLSIAQMPGGVPVATVAIGSGKNAGLLAVQMLAISDKKLMKKMIEYKKKLEKESLKKNAAIRN
ncbi:MAG TPA: 5-(carboxyamino)imidazole ribonucleotide mutase [Bacteroidetes bacterium]|nr:5-(carboxyamino)imidazole ribonucleotide mutase [Bacteroidota bacterium]